MKLIVGLGNPGRIYAKTRHNIGARLIQTLARDNRIVLKRSLLRSAQEGRGIIGGQETILAIPLTYMNLSGKALDSLIKRYKIKPQELLIVYDDLDLEFGRIKIKAGGGSAGHRGVNSIIESLKTQDFGRLRLGIGRPKHKEDVADFVLSPFNSTELRTLDDFLDKARQCCVDWLKYGIAKCMEKYNVRE
ncbi:MAG: aminoacyl-tRNA hydrolase [Candidatus Omnitrophica bacterium]|nr:aminoacyl-tRNA hydrolase [Candidatus Omnitrophota bacterium]